MNFSQFTKTSKNEKTNFPHNTCSSSGFCFRDYKPADNTLLGDGTSYVNSPEIMIGNVKNDL